MNDGTPDSLDDTVNRLLMALRSAGLTPEEQKSIETKLGEVLHRLLERASDYIAKSKGGNWLSSEEVFNRMWTLLMPQLAKQDREGLDNEQELRRYSLKILFRIFSDKEVERLKELSRDVAASSRDSQRELAAKQELFQKFCKKIALLETTHPEEAAALRGRWLIDDDERFAELDSQFRELKFAESGNDPVRGGMRKKPLSFEKLGRKLGVSQGEAKKRYDVACELIAGHFRGLGPGDFQGRT